MKVVVEISPEDYSQVMRMDNDMDTTNVVYIVAESEQVHFWKKNEAGKHSDIRPMNAVLSSEVLV